MTVRLHQEGLVGTVAIGSLLNLTSDVEKAFALGTVAWREFETWRGKQKQPQKKK